MNGKNFIPYGRQNIDQKDIAEVISVLKSDWITQGSKIEEFERKICEYTRAKYSVVVSSGAAALHLAALASGISPGDEVITSPLTFVASANCILYCGGTPVFADIEIDTGNISPKEIIKKITKKTKGIIPVHYAGHACNLEEIQKIAKKYKLFVIEDAAHALGAEYKKDKIGSCKYSDMTIFSFHPVKSITTGEGGAITTNNKAYYEKLLRLRTHGITKNKELFTQYNPKTDGDWYYEMQDLGFNYRLTDFQCALGISQMRKLNKFIKARREVANFYQKQLKNIQGITLPIEKQYVKSSWHIFPIRVNPKKRKCIFENLREKGIGVQVHYIPIYKQPYYKKYFKSDLSNYPNAEKFYQSEISIPVYAKISRSDCIRICHLLSKII
jgi:UDP-4-amino-4,6-dideoxy-N-acetyl-beta-L-altrosamine transaminase